MKWIVLAIIVCIVPYTWLTLAYRKENPAHQPYQDNKDRAQTLRLLDSGFYRFDVSLEFPKDVGEPPVERAEPERIAGGLPPLLRDLLIDRPTLPARLPQVSAPTSVPAGIPYILTFDGAPSDPGERAASAQLYQRGSQIVIVVAHDATSSELESRDLNATAQLTVPANTLNPGTYQVSLLGERESLRWTLTVL